MYPTRRKIPNPSNLPDFSLGRVVERLKELWIRFAQSCANGISGAPFQSADVIGESGDVGGQRRQSRTQSLLSGVCSA